MDRDRFDDLADAMRREEGKYLMERVTSEFLRSNHKNGLACIEEEAPGGRIIAHAVVLPSPRRPRVYEIAQVYVVPEERGKGLAKKVVGKCLEKDWVLAGQIFIIIRGEALAQFLLGRGFKEMAKSWFHGAEKWAASVDIADRFPERSLGDLSTPVGSNERQLFWKF